MIYLFYLFSSTDKFINDFDRQWYSEVGSKIMIGWIINVASPHCFHLFYVIYNSWMKKRASRYALFQKELNDCYLGAKFEVITKYAVALNTIFVTLFYCSGMPLLLILGCLSLAFQYWMEKYLSNNLKIKLLKLQYF